MVSNAKKNALASYTNTFVTAVVGIVVNPLLLGALGTTAFGAWKAIQRVLDLGAGANGGAMQSLKWVLAHSSKSGDLDRKRRDVGAALIVMLYWMPVLIAVSAVMVILLPLLTRDVPESDTGLIYATGAILGVNVLLTTVAAMPDAVLIGTNQGFRSMNVTTAVLVLTNVGMVVAATAGFSLTGLAVTMSIGTAINGTVTFLIVRRKVGWWGVAKPQRADLRQLSRFSGWVLVWTFVNRLSLATEVIVLSAFAGVAFVSSYTFTSYVVQFALGICLLTTSALMPKLGAQVGAAEWDSARQTATEAREMTLAIATSIGCLSILFNQEFVTIWAGAAQFMGVNVNIVMSIAFVQFAIMRTEAQIQDTGLQIGGKVILGMASVVLSIVLGGAAYLATQDVGWMLVGIIAGRMIGLIGMPILANRVVHTRSWPIYRSAVCAVLVIASVGLEPFVRLDDLISTILVGSGVTLVLGIVGYFLVLSPSTRSKILSIRRRS